MRVNTKKILIVFGTRPEAIKMAPLIKEFEKFPNQFLLKVCVTGQHRQMLDQVLEIFGIKPDVDLNLMAPNQDLFDITSKVLLGIREVLNDFKPKVVLVHGDTTTSIATALAAFYKKIKIGHVEAGLRTYNLDAPWPEEMNRQVTDRICDYYYASTIRAKENLLSEGISEQKIIVTGNTVVDALLIACNLISETEGMEEKIKHSLAKAGFDIANERRQNRKYILITGHRRENFGNGFLDICKSIRQLALENPKVSFVYPVHLNPNVKLPVYELLSGIDNVFLIPPVDYLPFVYLMKNSTMILTDSGGIQEEAPSLGKPVLVMRDVTERPEAVEAGTVILVGTNPATIIKSVNSLLNDNLLYERMSQVINPYGDGKASERIVKSLI